MLRILPLTLLLAGCGTMVNHSPYFNRHYLENGDRVYGGVRYHIDGLRDDFDELGYKGGIVRFLQMAGFRVTDLPLCFVADTLSLPFDIRAQLERRRKPAVADDVKDAGEP